MAAGELWNPDDLAVAGINARLAESNASGGRLVSAIGCLTGIAAAVGGFLPWVVYDPGGGNGVIRMSGVHASGWGVLAVVIGIASAVVALAAAAVADRQRGGSIALPAALGFLTCFAAMFQSVDLRGIGEVEQTGPGWMLAIGAFAVSLVVGSVLWMMELREHQLGGFGPNAGRTES